MAANKRAELRIVSAWFDRKMWSLHLTLSDGTEDEWSLLNFHELPADGNLLERLEIVDEGLAVRFVDIDAVLTFGFDDEDEGDADLPGVEPPGP
jgi:hypothetical protein